MSIAGISIANQAFSPVTKMSDSFAGPDFPADGLAGMGFQGLAHTYSPPFFRTSLAFSSYPPDSKLTSTSHIYVGGAQKRWSPKGSSRNRSSPSESQRQTLSSVRLLPILSFPPFLPLTFPLPPSHRLPPPVLGGQNPSYYTGALSYTPVTQSLYWRIGLSFIHVNNQPVPTLKSTDAIIDTGTTLAYGSYSDVAALWAAVPGSADMSTTYGAAWKGYYLFPCAQTVQMTLSFGGMGGKEFDPPERDESGEDRAGK